METPRTFEVSSTLRCCNELAARRDVRLYITAMEGFASKGGMLPEQVCDEANLLSAGLCLGRPSGSAMPLMWAHAEYIKLLRSVADGQVFDLIPIVAERYLGRGGRQDLEVWKPGQQVRQVSSGQTLRVQAPRPFLLHWSSNEWEVATDTPSITTPLGIGFVDIPIPAMQSAPIRFTFLWIDSNQWENRDYEVVIPTDAREDRPLTHRSRPASETLL